MAEKEPPENGSSTERHRNNNGNNATSPKAGTKEKLQPGFDCEFIESPKELQTDCPICLLVLRDPHQVTCCGYVYCRSCIERVKFDGKACPTCNGSDFTIFPDKSLHKSLYAFKVYCSKKSEGCNWTGELGKLDSHLNYNPSHLNYNPSRDLRFEGCEFVLVSCCYCSEFYPRKVLKNHEESKCMQRCYTCPTCNDFHSTFIDVTEKHLPQCLLSVPVPCEFSFAGCMELSVPEKVQQHLDQNVSKHLSLLASAYSTMREKLTEMQGQLDNSVTLIENLSKEKKERPEKVELEVPLGRELAEMKMMQCCDRAATEGLQSDSSCLPLTITLKEYEQLKKEGDMGWISDPFYTHQHGYLMCLWVDIGGNEEGKGKYISVFTSLLKGEFDDDLTWPFRGSLSVKVLNQIDKKLDHDEIIKYNERTPKASTRRIREEKKKAKPWGKMMFISHYNLKHTGFIVDDAIEFHIVKV